MLRLQLIFWLNKILGKIALSIIVIADDSKNVLVLVSFIALILTCFFLNKSNIDFKSKIIIFLIVTDLLNLVQLLFLIFLGFLGGLNFLLNLVNLTLIFSLENFTRFLFYFFRLIMQVNIYL